MIDWRFDEHGEEAWEEPQRPLPPQPNRITRRRVLLLLLLLLLLSSVGAVLARQVDQQVLANIRAVQAEVQRTHELAWPAAVRQDWDLYRLFLAAGDRRWRAVQQRLADDDLTVHRAPLGLWLDEAAAAVPISPTITLSDDFEQAIVHAERPFLTTQPDGSVQSVTLRLATFYAHERDQWAVAAPEHFDYFWGRTLVNDAGAQLALIYPNRDKVVARRLLADLDRLLRQACAAGLPACPADLQVRLVLSPDSTSLLQLGENVRALSMRRVDGTGVVYQLVLPTPTLVGVPQDEAGYDALRRGYAAWLLTALAYALPDTPPLLDEVSDVLAQIDLQLPPVSAYRPPVLMAEPDLPAAGVIRAQCREGERPLQVWHYTPATGAWQTADEQLAFPRAPTVQAETVTLPPMETLRSAVPAAERPQTLAVQQGVRQDETTWLVLAVGAEGRETFLFTVDESTGAVGFQTRLANRAVRWLPAMVTGNGRFLTLVQYTFDRSFVTIYDFITGRPQTTTFAGMPHGRFDWSPDEQWLVMVQDRALTLIAPAHEFERVVPLPAAGCETAVWMEK